MKLFVIALFVLLINAGVVSDAHAAKKELAPHLKGEEKNGVSYTIRNLEVLCKKDNYRFCYTDLTPKHLR